MVWKTLSHPNILPLLGVTRTWNRLVLVSEWMENSNINVFVKVHPDANRLGLVRSRLASLSPPDIEVHMIIVACRRYQGVDIFTPSGYGPRRTQRGTYLDSSATRFSNL